MTFHEEQKFSEWFAVLGILLFLILFFSLRDELSTGILFLILITSILPFALILLTKLKTTIDHNGIEVSFFPLVKHKQFTWSEDIIDAEVIKYAPIKDYGGWGLRKSFKNGTAYNVSGNQGIKLLLSNQKLSIVR